MTVQNAKIADILDEIADLIELKEGNEFRIRSYRNAARTVRDLSERIADLAENGEDLRALPNIGEGTAEKIGEILEKGTCRRLEELKKDVPEELTEIMGVPQVGPRKAVQLHDELGVESLEDLRKAAEDHRIRDLEGMGPKTEEKILKGLETVAETSGRISLKAAADQAESLGAFLDGIDELDEWEIAGSFRRWKETIGDLDVLVRAEDRSAATDRILEFDAIEEVVSKGRERVTVRLESGLQIDFRFFEEPAFGAALLYFTGSKAHNIKLRKRAVDREWKLNEYGLFSGKRRLAGKSEESVYHRLNMTWVPPELREERGEIEAALDDDLPSLIEQDDIRGDLHCHTTETDGNASIKEMAEAARDRGYDYLAITDHSKAVRMANGLNNDRLRKHAETIRRTNGSFKGLRILAGVEVDILKSGRLDLDEDVLADLDWVVGSVHYHWNLSRRRMTDRLIAAIESGVVHCLGHPLGRMIGKRDPIEVELDEVFEACREHDVRLEINSQPHRLDLPDVHCQRARKAGVGFTISTDAHKPSDLHFMRFGVATARRGWLEKAEVLNTSTTRSLTKKLKRG
ncbi:MAG: DNA polymerase/3'-5' exonuclease PolX [Planctomycetota bacterium]|nr:DNA polymerase/3'-5' exonuclease PolX [Planctomycetota bacterium]